MNYLPAVFFLVFSKMTSVTENTAYVCLNIRHSENQTEKSFLSYLSDYQFPSLFCINFSLCDA